MDGISWTDLDADEQRVIAMLRDGVTTESCDPVALLSLKRIGFIKKQRGEGIYLVSVQGFGEREWNEADMVKVEEPPHKWNHTFNRHV